MTLLRKRMYFINLTELPFSGLNHYTREIQSCFYSQRLFRTQGELLLNVQGRRDANQKRILGSLKFPTQGRNEAVLI